MSFTHTVTKSVITASGVVSDVSAQYTGSGTIEIDEVVADAATDFEVVASIDVSAVQSFIVISDKAVTLETNSGSVPDDTLVLVANKAYQWDTGSYNTFLLVSADITSIFFTNASGSDANIKIRCVLDTTP
jgi:hypothetical protein